MSPTLKKKMEKKMLKMTCVNSMMLDVLLPWLHVFLP